MPFFFLDKTRCVYRCDLLEELCWCTVLEAPNCSLISATVLLFKSNRPPCARKTTKCIVPLPLTKTIMLVYHLKQQKQLGLLCIYISKIKTHVPAYSVWDIFHRNINTRNTLPLLKLLTYCCHYWP